MNYAPFFIKLEMSLEIGPELGRTVITIVQAGLYYLIAASSPLG